MSSCCSCLHGFLRQNFRSQRQMKKSAKNVHNGCFTGEKMVLYNRYIFWQILEKLKKNFRNGFFAESQKPRNDVKFASDVNIFCQNWPKTAKIYFYRWTKMILCKISFFGTYWQIKKKSLERIFSKSQNPEMTSILHLTSIYLAKIGQKRPKLNFYRWKNGSM